MTQRRYFSFWPTAGMLLCFILLQVLISAGLYDFGIAAYRYGAPLLSTVSLFVWIAGLRLLSAHLPKAAE